MTLTTELGMLESFLWGHGFTIGEIARVLTTLKEETASGAPSLDCGIDAVRSWVEHGDFATIVCARLKGDPV